MIDVIIAMRVYSVKRMALQLRVWAGWLKWKCVINAKRGYLLYIHILMYIEGNQWVGGIRCGGNSEFYLN